MSVIKDAVRNWVGKTKNGAVNLCQSLSIPCQTTATQQGGGRWWRSGWKFGKKKSPYY